ncbi:ABC transporter substrate-binding protein [Stenotrophomonas sp. CFBP 13718]|uniref:ABC transporter substrate-binding protein n=1 Tax=Stenotrophomonas sp. CFBP 13718 TaxID=2775304 RepID=UPI001781D250|nr:ABC transporter substrate-binding protein [Stenotrophomonas sp. CFBP 13718]MBD8695383.1 ABC transporter substrate-binding protein [Stenotrophomonas sp. CFBP 13718]
MRIATTLLAAGLALALSGCGLKQAGADGAKAASLGFGKTAVGEITSASPLSFSDGSRYQLYAIELKDKQAVSLKLSGALSGALSVFREDGTLVTRGEASEEGPVEVTFRADGAGRYRVAVNGDGASAYGPYRLQAAEVVPYDGKPLVGSGQIVDLLASDRQEYTLQVEKAGLYQIDLASGAFDTVLELHGPNVDEEDDDGGSSTNSRMNLMLEPGTYTLAVKSIDDSSSGQFRLDVKNTALSADIVSTDGTTISPGITVQALLSREDGERRFMLNVPQAGPVRIDALSDQVDTTLQLNGPTIDLSDDDGGSGTNARLQANLPAGRYQLVVASLEERQAVVQVRVSNEGGESLSLRDAANADVAVPVAEAVDVDTP